MSHPSSPQTPHPGAAGLHQAYRSLPLGGAVDAARLAAERPPLPALPTPLVTVSDAAISHNISLMARWCADAGVSLAPHGKTTMSPEIWQRQLDAGAWGITVATPWQAAVALDAGVPRVLLANALVQPSALASLAPHTDRLWVWADSLRAVEIMDAALRDAGASVPLDVLVELGGDGGRTGARTQDEALAIARGIAASPVLRLAGVAGYEGALAHDATDASLGIVRGYLRRMAGLHGAIAEAGLYDGGEAIVTAGGSAYFDAVADELGALHDPDGRRGLPARVLLRSGAYVAHDDGFYRAISPLGLARSDAPFRSAIHGWTTVVSRPEPGLALVDAGKRDFSFDEGLPEPQGVRRFGDTRLTPLRDAQATAMNDQHTFVRFPPETEIAVGDVIRFGLSHPCTVFDKWRGLVLVDDDRADEPRAVGVVETSFG